MDLACHPLRNEQSGISANTWRRLGTYGTQCRDGLYFYQYLTPKRGLFNRFINTFSFIWAPFWGVCPGYKAR